MRSIFGDSFEASRFERRFESKLEKDLLEKGIELVRILKYGFNEEAPRYELKYNVFIKSTSRENRNWMKYTYGMDCVKCGSNYDVFTCNFVWYSSSCEELERYSLGILGGIGLEIDAELYKSMYEFLEKGIKGGFLEELVPERNRGKNV